MVLETSVKLRSLMSEAHRSSRRIGISLLTFRIRNLKSNLDVVNSDGDVVKIEGELFTDAEKIKWNENELSCAVAIEYGAFRYYEGGDQEAHRNKFGEMDTITPTAKAAGPVDVATANDHGQGVNQAFSDLLDPRGYHSAGNLFRPASQVCDELHDSFDVRWTEKVAFNDRYL